MRRGASQRYGEDVQLLIDSSASGQLRTGAPGRLWLSQAVLGHRHKLGDRTKGWMIHDLSRVAAAAPMLDQASMFAMQKRCFADAACRVARDMPAVATSGQ